MYFNELHKKCRPSRKRSANLYI